MKNNLVFLKILDFFSRKSKVWLSLSFYSDYKTLHQVTEPLLSNVTYELSLVLRPELRTANCAFPASGEKAVEMLEKVLRAVMLRLMSDGPAAAGLQVLPYPSQNSPRTLHNIWQICLSGTMEPVPGLWLHPALSWLYVFQWVYQCAGPPWRKCDTFDELYSNIGEQMFLELEYPRKSILHIEELAKDLYNNENCSVTRSGQITVNEYHCRWKDI